MNKIYYNFSIGLMIFLISHGVVITSAEPAYIVDTFGQTGTSSGDFSDPHGMLIHNDRLYVLDASNNRVQIFNLQGEFIREFDSSGSASGVLNSPQYLTTNGSHLFITDYGNDLVQIFDLDGTYAGELSVISPIGVDYYDGLLYVVDGYFDVINVYNASTLNTARTHIATRQIYSDGYDSIINATGLEVHDGTIYVADNYNGTVKTFSVTGEFLGYFGEREFTLSEGKIETLDQPESITVKNNRIFVSDKHDKIAVFDLSGDFLGGISGDFDGPVDTVLSDKYLYVSEAVDNHISVIKLVASPEDVVVLSDGVDISISWQINPSHGIADELKYEVYRNSTSSYDFLGTTENQYFQDITAEQNKSYSYDIVAISEIGNSEPVSSNVISMEIDRPKPDDSTDNGVSNASGNQTEGSSVASFIDNLSINHTTTLSVFLVIPLLRRLNSRN